MIVVHPLGTARKPANGCLVETLNGMCPYVATDAVTVRPDPECSCGQCVAGPIRSMVCGVHRIGLRDEGRLAGAAPITEGRSS